MEIVSAVTRADGTHIIALEVKGVTVDDFNALVSGNGHLEVVLHSVDGTDKLAIAAHANQKDGAAAFVRFDVSKS